jgi:hypothetical protein
VEEVRQVGNAAEGAKFQKTVTDMTELAKSVTAKEIKETKDIIAKNYKFKADKIAKTKAKAKVTAARAKKAKAKNGT